MTRAGVTRRAPGGRARFLAAWLACLLPLAAVGQEASPPEDENGAEVTIAVDVASRYVWRGLVLNDETVAQPSVSVAVKGFSIDIWANVDATDFSADQGGPSKQGQISEWDLYAGYSHSFGKAGVTAGYARYEYPDTGLDETNEVWLGLEADLAVTLFATAWHEITGARGWFFEAGASRDIELGERVTLSLGLDLGWADDSWADEQYGVGSAGFTHVGVGADLSIQVGEHVGIRPFARWSTVIDDDFRDAVDRPDALVLGLGCDLGF